LSQQENAKNNQRRKRRPAPTLACNHGPETAEQ
jgi:hypothetical protein